MFCPVNFGSVFSQQVKVILLFGLSGVLFSQKAFVLLLNQNSFRNFPS